MLSVRALSTPECGQRGPLLSTEISVGLDRRCSRKNGAPESYGQGDVSRCGAKPVSPTIESPTETTLGLTPPSRLAVMVYASAFLTPTSGAVLASAR